MAESENIEGNDACVMMHTALRKCCDSKITSAAYNVIHLLCEMDFKPYKFHPWRVYGALVAERMASPPLKPGLAKGLKLDCGASILKRAATDLDDRFHAVLREAKEKRETVPDNCRSALHALTCVLACFDDKDWCGMAAYLEPQEMAGMK